MKEYEKANFEWNVAKKEFENNYLKKEVEKITGKNDTKILSWLIDDYLSGECKVIIDA